MSSVPQAGPATQGWGRAALHIVLCLVGIPIGLVIGTVIGISTGLIQFVC